MVGKRVRREFLKIAEFRKMGRDQEEIEVRPLNLRRGGKADGRLE
jgi:hypothetical protein